LEAVINIFYKKADGICNLGPGASFDPLSGNLLSKKNKKAQL